MSEQFIEVVHFYFNKTATAFISKLLFSRSLSTSSKSKLQNRVRANFHSLKHLILDSTNLNWGFIFKKKMMDWFLVDPVLGIIGFWFDWSLVWLVLGWIGHWLNWLDLSFIGLVFGIIGIWFDRSLVGSILGWIGPWLDWSMFGLVPWLDQSKVGSVGLFLGFGSIRDQKVILVHLNMHIFWAKWPCQ